MELTLPARKRLNSGVGPLAGNRPKHIAAQGGFVLGSALFKIED
jgi:hypothetical protein